MTNLRDELGTTARVVESKLAHDGAFHDVCLNSDGTIRFQYRGMPYVFQIEHAPGLSSSNLPGAYRDACEELTKLRKDNEVLRGRLVAVQILCKEF